MQLGVAGVQEGLVLELVDAVVEVGEDREEAVDERVDDPVEQLAGIVDRFLALHVALPHLGERRRFVAVDGDEELLGVEAVHLDEAVVVRDGSVDDDEDEVVVFVELRALRELLGVLDGERVELEDVAQDRVVGLVRLVDIDPEEGVAGEELLDVLAAEVHLFAAAVVDDRAGVRRRTPLVLGRVFRRCSVGGGG